ncbi:MAG TPA: hypothetical protein VJH87_14935 [Vicinamibacteria bacterium]|nr:hypothetical protein [Vicinamibacteria bacterium]
MKREASKKRTVWLLGPQYQSPFLKDVFPSFGVPEGPIATVTAGWQEREGDGVELDELNWPLAGRAFDLELYRRADQAFHADPELARAHREMQRRLRALTRIYDQRLSFFRESILWLLEESGDPRLLDPEREHAFGQIRDLDAWHLKRIVEIRGEFEERFRPSEREAVARERETLARALSDAAALAIAGGHVAVLLNRLRLFGVKEMVAGKPVIAWSAGAMALTDRVVLFHDHPPQGAGNAGVMERGLGLCPGLVALPDGKKRLDLGNRFRVSAMARRFQPDSCVVLEQGDCISFDGERWRALSRVVRLGADGELERVSSW